MVQGAVGGCIDFSWAEARSPLWRTNLLLRVRELSRQQNIDVLQQLYDRKRTYIDCPHISDEAAAENMKHEFRLLGKLLAEKTGDATMNRTGQDSIIKQARSMWARKFGDPDDPAVRARIEATAKALAGN